ncbi:hypothetical protein E2C01_065108 [Portunus trituberculatus]|uniref:Secreted protein n=1 Tax=Portunus trituberculatus TaxID=210409 RepID=A0A5B7HNQ6_PORTR|nr:hypothetical protein [Portunus trituberculatus]
MNTLPQPALVVVVVVVGAHSSLVFCATSSPDSPNSLTRLLSTGYCLQRCHTHISKPGHNMKQDGAM